jgi:toxin ParE1/3/4
MAQVIWALSAQVEFDAIVTLMPEVAARRFAQKVVRSTRQLEHFPNSGPRIPEMPHSHFRHLVIPPCRIFYRVDESRVVIQFIMRTERLFQSEFLR